MDYEAIDWALTAPVKPSSAAHVLLALACRANKELLCFPSMPRLIADTGLNEKTVSKAIADLQVRGLLVYTGNRCGSRGRTKIYRLAITEIQQEADCNTPENGGIEGADTSEKLSTDTPKSGGIESDNTPKSGGTDCANTPKNGGFKYPQKRGSESFKDFESLNLKTNNYPPLLNTEAWQLWIDYRKERGQPDYLPMEYTQVWNLIIAQGNHEKQLATIKNTIACRWKHIHPLGGSNHEANRKDSGDVFASGTDAAFTGENW